MRLLAPSSLVPPAGDYSYGVCARGFVYTAGIVGTSPTGELADSIEKQTHQTIDNIRLILAEAGASLTDVVSATVYLRDLADYRAFTVAWSSEFGEHRPARATVQSQLVHASIRVEIQVIATQPDDHADA
jgi:2-iminobutanoate/2-iminopropanoate deaminase